MEQDYEAGSSYEAVKNDFCSAIVSEQHFAVKGKLLERWILLP